MSNLFNSNTATITMNTYNGIKYAALAAFDGDNYPKSIRKMLAENGSKAYQSIVNANDKDNILVNLLKSKYRKLANGMIYVNPWITDVTDKNGNIIRTADEEKAFWFKHKGLAKLMEDRLPATDPYWILKDMCILNDKQFNAVIDAAEINFYSTDIQYLLFIGDSEKNQYPILKSTGDEVTKDSVFESDRHGLKDRIENLLGGLPIMVDQRDNPKNWDWFVPVSNNTPEGQDKLRRDHIRGLDLEPEKQIDPEREAINLYKDSQYGYTWSNIGWALARSANSWKCGGPKVEASFSEEFYELLEEDAPAEASEFFRWLDIEWGNTYNHISPDQKAMWAVVHDLSEHGTAADKEGQFLIFKNWLFAVDRCKQYITSYLAEPMYGPKATSYRKVAGDICGDAEFTSWENLSWLMETNEDEEEEDSVEEIPIEFFEEEEDDFDF